MAGQTCTSVVVVLYVVLLIIVHVPPCVVVYLCAFVISLHHHRLAVLMLLSLCSRCRSNMTYWALMTCLITYNSVCFYFVILWVYSGVEFIVPSLCCHSEWSSWQQRDNSFVWRSLFCGIFSQMHILVIDILCNLRSFVWLHSLHIQHSKLVDYWTFWFAILYFAGEW